MCHPVVGVLISSQYPVKYISGWALRAPAAGSKENMIIDFVYFISGPEKPYDEP
jgi:hypothetical protein